MKSTPRYNLLEYLVHYLLLNRRLSTFVADYIGYKITLELMQWVQYP